LWFGCGSQRLAFCFDSDLDIFLSPGDKESSLSPAAQTLYQVFTQTRGKLDYSEIVMTAPLKTRELNGALWELFWQGLVVTDDYQDIRTLVLKKCYTWTAG